MPSDRSSHVSSNSQSQQPGWGPPRAPLPPHRLAKLANALGVAAPLPATASNGAFLSHSAITPGQSPPQLDIPWRAATPSISSLHNVASSSQSKYLLHVIPPSYLPHDSDTADSSELIPPPPGASGYHTQFRRGILVTLQSTLQAQLVVIAREYALPSTFGMVLYLVRASPQDDATSSTHQGIMEPGPRLSEDMWKHIWARVLRAERDDTSSSSPSPSPNTLGLGISIESNSQTQALRPLVTPTRTETPSPLPLINPVTPSSTFVSSVPDLRSQFKSERLSTSHSDPDTPDNSSDQELPGIELPGLKSPSIIPILAKVEFDIDRRRAGWYEPWLRSRRITHARRTESRSSNRTGSHSRTGDEASPSDDRRAPFDLKLVERMQKPGFLRSMNECDEMHPPNDEYNPLSDSLEAMGDEELADGTTRIISDKDPLSDVFGTDAETWEHMRSNSKGTRKKADPNVVQLALDASSLAHLHSEDERGEQDSEVDDVDEVHAIMQRMSGPHLTSPTAAGSKRPIPPPLVLGPKSPKDVVLGNPGSAPSSQRTSTNLPYVNGINAAHDSDFRNKEGLSLELEEEYLRSRSPTEDKRVGALFESLDLGLDFDDDEEYDENDPNDRRRSQYLMKARLDEIERTLVQFSPGHLKTNSLDEDLTITHRHTFASTSQSAYPDSFGSKTYSPTHDRQSSSVSVNVNGAAWPAVPYSTVSRSVDSPPPSRSSNFSPSPPKLALNGVTTGAPKAFLPQPGVGTKNGISSETEARRREIDHSTYPTTVPAPFTRQTDLTSDSPIPLSPDPFGRYPSMYEDQLPPVPTYWDPATKQFSHEPTDSRPSTSSVDEYSLSSTTQSSRFSADSSIAIDQQDKNGKAQGSLVSVKSLKRLWRRSKGSSVPTAQPPTPTAGKTSFQPQQLGRAPSQEQLGPPPVTTAAARNGKVKAPLNQLHFDQESPYPIHPGRPSLNGNRPISPPVPPPLVIGEKTTVRKSILKWGKAVTGVGTHQNPGVSSEPRKSSERPVSNETVKPRRPSVLEGSVPPSPKLPEHLLQSNHARNGSGIFERRKSAGRSKMGPKANYSSSSQDMLSINSQPRSSVVMQASGSVSPSHSQFSMESGTEGRGSFDTAQFEVISAPKVHPNLTYPYQTLDYE
ncbi:hypothetical protein V8B97DRAFT_2009399 [Scleroderma yunnanense]